MMAVAVVIAAAPARAAELRVERTVPSAGSGVWTDDGHAPETPATAFFAGTGPAAPAAAFAPGIDASAECYTYDTNALVNGGLRFIPPDPYCAAGPDHVIVIGNCVIEWRPKQGFADAPQYRSSLQAFFAQGLPAPSPNPGPGTTLGTATFDPKVLYDQYAGRFVVITLERWDTASGNASNQSRILVAVSKTSDPNGGFWFHAIDSKVNIGGVDGWADYPGFAVDDKAVYITNNLFQFVSLGGSFQGVRLWIINKTTAYNGPDNGLTFLIRNPYATGGVATTTQPAHMFGAVPNGSGGRPLGTFLVAYSGLTDGTNEYVQFVEVTDPLAAAGGPFFAVQQLNLGNLEDTNLAMPDAPQLGSSFQIETNDRRLLNAVWRANHLYCTATIRPLSGPDAAQATARWWRFNTANTTALTQADAGNAGAEDLGAGTHTFFPQVMVDEDGNMALGFSASNAAIYAGAYYATRATTDPAGTLTATGTLAAGMDYYKRFFSGTRNRWGDYSGLALDPSNEIDFWVFNEYAGPRGSNGTGSQGAEDGRWYTRAGRFHIKPYLAVAISSFDATAEQGRVLLRAEFRSDLGVEAVHVYRADADGPMARIASMASRAGSFTHADGDVDGGRTYRYQIGVVDGDGEFYSPIRTVTVPAWEVSLGQNVPNPFNPSTSIRFVLAERASVRLAVYDAAGRHVRTLLDGAREAGPHDAAWDGRDDGGRVQAAGVYFYRLDVNGRGQAKKMVLLK
jgi:hypothetical protein